MQTIITSLASAAVKVAAVGTMTAGMLLGYCESIEWITPRLKAAVQYQERTVSLYEENFPGPRAQQVRREWEQSKAQALTGIVSLEASAASLLETAASLTNQE